MLKAVSLFTGVGGLDFGFEAAGFETAVALDNDAAACRTLRLNRKWPVLEGDIHDIPSSTIMEWAGLAVGEADVLIGGPPCQPFSKSSYWINGDAPRLDDPRADTLTAYLRVLRDLRPRAFLLENVPGLTYKGKDEGFQHLVRGIALINKECGTNYRVACKAINTAHYGVPQIRERVFLVGSRDGHDFAFPSPTHSAPGNTDPLEGRLDPYRTAWDAIGDLPELPSEPSLTVGGKWGELLPSIPEGQNYLWHTNRSGGLPLFGWRTRYWSFLLKLAKRLPSWTIQAQPGSAIGPFHWNNRRLSVREMCRLQTFPEGLRFECGRSDAQRQLGNAVPSLIAEILGREIRRQLLNDDTDLSALRLLQPVRKPIPEPEPVSPVSEKYLSLAGDHADHSGKRRRQTKGPVSKVDPEEKLFERFAE